MSALKRTIFFSTLVDLRLAEAGVTHVIELSEELAKKGYDVTVFAFGNRAIKGARVHELRSLRKYSRIVHYVTGFTDSFFSLMRDGSRKKPDLVHERHSFFSSGFYAAKLLGVPIVTEVNGLFTEEHKQKNYFKGVVKKVFLKFAEWIDLRFVKAADAVVAVTPEIKRYYVGKGVDEKKIVVASNGVNTRKIKPRDGSSARKKLGYVPGDKIIAYAGSLRAGEGVSELIHAFPLVRKRVPAAKLLVIGDSKGSGGVVFHPTLEELEEEAMRTGLAVGAGKTDAVRFTGRVPHDELQEYLAAADACVYPLTPSKQGSSHLKVFEYLACGKPVVATRMPGLDFLERKKCGYNFDYDEASEGKTVGNLAEAMVKALLAAGARTAKNMSANARRVAVQDFSWEKTAENVVKAHEIALKHAQLRG